MSRALALLALVASFGCAVLGADEEAAADSGSPDALPVVHEERGGFDPAEAVYDDRDPELHPLEAVATEAAAARDERRLQRAVRRTDESERIEDDAAKAALARNEPPRPRGASEAPSRAALDLALEGLLVVLAALLVTVLVRTIAGALRRRSTGLRRAPRESPRESPRARAQGQTLAAGSDPAGARHDVASTTRALRTESLPRPLRALWIAGRDFFEDRVPTLAAALAFYTSLSLAPLIILLLYVCRALGPRAEDQLVAQVNSVVGAGGGEVVRAVIENAERRTEVADLAGVIGLAVLAVSASGVFGQLQAALNRIWEVEARPGARLGTWVRKRLLSFGMIGVMAFLFLASLAASPTEHAEETLVWRAVSMLGSLAVFTLLFALVFKFLPDVVLEWRDVWGGALVTAVLFVLGKYGIGVYLAQRGLESAYGAAGSLAVLLTWVYFTAILVFFGAELTQGWVRASGRTMLPNRFARRVERPQRASAA